MGSSGRICWNYSENAFRFSSQSQLRGGLSFRCPKDFALYSIIYSLLTSILSSEAYAVNFTT